MLTSSVFLAQILSESEDCQQILQQTCCACDRGILRISCSTQELLDQVRDRLQEISRRATSQEIYEIVLLLGQAEVNRFNPFQLLHWSNYMEIPLLSVISSCQDEIAVIRMQDNRGLFITNALASSDRCNANDWTGDDIFLKYNIPEHFEAYISALIRHEKMTHYPLICLDGQGNQQQQTINAWLTMWRGDLVRVVQVLDKTYL